MKTKILLSVAAVAFCLTAGCNRVTYTRAQEAKYRKPTVAVMTFENRVPVRTRWRLGDDLADQLVDRLIQTRRYTVLEPQQQKSSFSRKSSQNETSQTNQIRYIIRGTITDFGYIESSNGIKRVLEGDWFGKNVYAYVGTTVYVMDAQSGHILTSKSFDAKVKAGKAKDDEKEKSKDNSRNDNMAFGSFTFYKTAMGKATAKVLDDAVYEIVRAITDQPYQPKVSSMMNGQVIINGGRDRKIEVGNEYVVRPKAQAITDPDTGYFLGNITGEVIGRIRVTQVTDKYSIAIVLFGDQFEPGQTLFLSETESSRSAILPVVKSY